ncbi:MAG: putative geopeptide radical SAM maturase [Desulforudis sp.]|nr:MAG: putative geopeptide radical SAM maturase [Desulforudis sp.]
MTLVPSRYLKIFPWPGDPGYLLLYSTKNAARALLPTEDGLKLRAGEVPADHAEELAGLGMAVADPEAERAEVFDLLTEINRQDEGLNVSVILGLACNFSCVYCYEGTLKQGQAMTEETCGRLVTFLAERYLARGRTRLRLDFYGGEPLLYMDRIKAIAGPLQNFVEERGGNFSFSLVTNGSLLTRAVVRELLPFGLHAAKVTVDGPPDEHNRLRPFRNGGESFAAIMANVRACHDLVRIGFGGNYTRENFARVGELLDLALADGLGPDTLGQVQFHPVMQTADSFANPEFSGGCRRTDEPWLADAALSVREEAIRRGFPVPRLIPSPCMVDLDEAMVVNHDGTLFKCVAMIGHPEYAVGDLWQGLADAARICRRDLWRENEECRACAYLPLCFGGCRYMAMQRTDEIGLDCRREFYDRTLEGTVRQDAMSEARGQRPEDSVRIDLVDALPLSTLHS